LSKVLEGQTKILEGENLVKADKCMGISKLLGARARAYALHGVAPIRQGNDG